LIVAVAVFVCVSSASALAGDGFQPVGALSSVNGLNGCSYDPSGFEAHGVDGDPLAGACSRVVALAGPESVAMSSDGRSVYVASFDSSGLAVFARDPNRGALRQLAGRDGCIANAGTSLDTCVEMPDDILQSPEAVAVSPDGRNVYAVSPKSAAVVIFSRNQATGALTALKGADSCISSGVSDSTCSSGRALLEPMALAISSDGKSVYVADLDSNSIDVFSRDQTTGKLTQLAGTDGCISGSDPEKLEEYGASQGCLFDQHVAGPTAVAVTADGRNVYLTSAFFDLVAGFTRDTTTGKLTAIPGEAGCVAYSSELLDVQCSPGPAIGGPFGLAVSPDGRNVYVASGFDVNGTDTPTDGNGITVLTRDRSTGGISQLQGTAGCITVGGTNGQCVAFAALKGSESVVVSPDGQSVYTAAASSQGVVIFSRNTTTGALTPLPGNLGCLSVIEERCTRVRTLDGASSIATSPDGQTLYVTAFWSNAISRLNRAEPVTTLVANVTGSGLKPMGDPDGTGQITLRIQRPTICWAISTRRIGAMLSARVHRKGNSSNKFSFRKPTGCLAATWQITTGLRSRPADYYIDIQTRDHPTGAVRGRFHAVRP
jgi:DNA-binding beta-propeller fold protein YncE